MRYDPSPTMPSQRSVSSSRHDRAVQNLVEPARNSPLLAGKQFRDPSVLKPENMLREARRQKGLPNHPVPRICVLDPDGDIARLMKREAADHVNRHWACFHTEMVLIAPSTARQIVGSPVSESIGCVGCAVGAPFAVMIAEQLFACGCELLISLSSAGQLSTRCPPPCFLLIERALRDEGTSHHYAEAEEFSCLDTALSRRLDRALAGFPIPIVRGASWTTDAPFRETAEAVAKSRAKGLDAVEMEAAALYAFARARNRAVICLAQITNNLGQSSGEFEKGEANGARAALALISAIASEFA